MASTDLQSILRFLSQDAKIPLATAMTKVKGLQEQSLMTPESIAKTNLKTVMSIFGDDKISKQVYNAARRVTKKRSAPESGSSTSPAKRGKTGASTSESSSAEDLEHTLALPASDKTPEELEGMELFTNRAPLVLAFCVILLKYTMPGQPVSSRLSLAQAYVSISSRARAVDLGIESGASAQEQGWGAGQPTVKIMGKDIRVMRRSGYEQNRWGTTEEDMSSQGTLHSQADGEGNKELPLWGLDLEALKSSSFAGTGASNKSSVLPIYTPQSARSYLLRSAGSVPRVEEGKPTKKQTSATKAKEVEQNLGMLLKSIDLVYESWLPELGTGGLDRKTWGWYAQVRPEIATGKAGWGAKNTVRLKDILALRKQT